jgi:hypothetical protein
MSPLLRRVMWCEPPRIPNLNPNGRNGGLSSLSKPNRSGTRSPGGGSGNDALVDRRDAKVWDLVREKFNDNLALLRLNEEPAKAPQSKAGRAA